MGNPIITDQLQATLTVYPQTTVSFYHGITSLSRKLQIPTAMFGLQNNQLILLTKTKSLVCKVKNTSYVIVYCYISGL